MAAPSEPGKPAGKLVGADHIVDTLIKERAPQLSGSPVWPLVRPALYALLDYRKARAMADAIAPLGGRETLDYGSRLLDLRVAVDDALKPVRPDLIFFANADAHRINPRLDEVFIPVEWVEAKRTRERTRLTVSLAQAALEAERAIIIFPAGRISRRTPDGGLADPAWAPSALSLARRYKADVLPIHLAGPPSNLFWLFDRIWGELRDVTLFHELLNKHGGNFRLTIGPVIPWAVIVDPAEATPRLKTYVERTLPSHPDQPFA